MIQKRIFYVWGANESKPEKVLKCIESWKKNLPDYEIIEINDESKEYFDFQEELKRNKWFKTVYERKMWAYVADYVRVKVLYNNGGIYLDTDVEVIKDMSPLLNNPAFVGLQDEKRTEPAILGAQKGNPFLKKVLDFYNQEIWTSELYKIPDIFEYFINIEKNHVNYITLFKLQNYLNLKDLTIYSKEYFIPFKPQLGEKASTTNNTYTIHWFEGNWLKPEILYFLENKNKLPIDIINENLKTNSQNILKKYRVECLYRKKIRKLEGANNAI